MPSNSRESRPSLPASSRNVRANLNIHPTRPKAAQDGPKGGDIHGRRRPEYYIRTTCDGSHGRVRDRSLESSNTHRMRAATRSNLEHTNHRERHTHPPTTHREELRSSWPVLAHGCATSTSTFQMFRFYYWPSRIK
ncbi:hypothetical protein CDEST_06630 [Colletotrichum destructivum]|uniref:Uncharacterized protein n=1 Tax=Colletotrichum destructivum TaxID=34406 RepID=A0AAX4IER3_9PEZI|nr:hypothetical protein CDEST_06630 [Colletotrichum destructivum]